MAQPKSSNTHIHEIRTGYSPKADGPKNPPKGGSWASQSSRAGQALTSQVESQQKK